MKNSAVLLFLTAPILLAGAPDPVLTAPEKSASWITPTVDIRARYEFADVDGFDVSHGLTVRERLGFKTAEFYGFSAVAEGEFTQVLVDDFNSGAAGAYPVKPGNSNITAPQSNELNQAYVQYAAFESTVRLGRQRIIYDNAAFVGNVGWRQNEQTFDGISFSSKFFDGLTFNYAYIDRVNRVFGSESDGTNKDVTGDIHLVNLSYTGIKGLTLGSYAYLMDFDAPDGWDNDTFGLSAKGTLAGIQLYGELAYQNEAGAANGEEAFYAHFDATKKFGEQAITLGFEHLDAGFQTPLATLHSFNGSADVFNTARAGGTLSGLTDLYLSHTMPIFWGIKWANVLHAFGDDNISTDLGWEYDSTLTKKFDDHFTAIAQFSHFETESAFPTTTRFTMELNYTF